ncbi:hypothetical protein [Nostoc sp. CHAB 5715]|uniref:hypothetical protein n=1 Tax=Nostoc sp. CHAB 5715 TaxID=2780400 RepID=UPI001E465EBB|nr:hypothetical protein [Nostoc sp. CHAB 5715]MCC5622641.1 hypothetical protein [Nostoc sp. CHAB 5715]
MPKTPIPPDVSEFILAHIDSIAAIEALVLLVRHADEELDEKKLAARLYITEPEAGLVLQSLCAEGLVAFDGTCYQYKSTDEKLHSMVERVVFAYQKHLIPVTRLVHSRPQRIREFADAFRFRKDRG